MTVDDVKGAVAAIGRDSLYQQPPEQRIMLDDAALREPPTAVATGKPLGPGLRRERVLSIKHYTDKLFSFRTTRSPSFRFQSGQFAMIGLETEGRPLLRAYSMTSAVYDDHLEFFSIKVPNGPLTSRLQHISVGDDVVVNGKPTGTLLLSNLQPGKRLWLFATGTGFAPFASILRDPETYEAFDKVIAVEGCRETAELEFATNVVTEVRQHEYLGEAASEKLLYYATVTREQFHHQGRISDLIISGKMTTDLGIDPFGGDDDRVMMCGNPQMLADMRSLLQARGFSEGSSGTPGEFVIEKAFVEK
jgi:ferredoxin--NADP+ reductase